MSLGSRRERYFLHNSLLCLAKALEGKNVLVDLRNECSVLGHLEAVDGFMNLSMLNVSFINQKEQESRFDNFFVQARNIRYLHIPDTMPIIPAMKGQLSNMSQKPFNAASNIRNTYKGRNLLKRQQETLESIRKME